jgi:hypothetical protein
MKISKLLLVILSFVYLIGCGGSDSVRKDMPDTIRVMETLTVGQDGKLDYVGTGDFSGFGITIDDTRLAGKTIYVEKSDIPGTVDNYNSLSSKYSVRFTQYETAQPTDLYNAVISIPYQLSGSATVASTVMLTLLKPENKDAIQLSASKPADGILKVTNASFPAAFFAGYKVATVTPEQNTFIKLVGKSILDAQQDSEFSGTDSNNVKYRDRVRALSNVQPGEKVTLTIDEGAFGEKTISTSWTVTFSNTEVATSQDKIFTFLPDRFGDFTVALSATGISANVKTETLTIRSRAYSYDIDTNESYCLKFCHSTIDAPNFLDVYGRPVMRDIIAVWQDSSHASAQKSSNSCAECHSTGAFRVDRATTGNDEFPGAYGYDDLATADRQHLMGVTCEACHGPSSTYSGALNGDINFDGHPEGTSIDSGVCLSCHEHGRDNGSHFSKYYFEQDNKNVSTHETANELANYNTLTKNESCFKCHTGEGAIGAILGADIKPSDFNKFSGITCNVCHDPHGEVEGDNPHAQLRKTGNTTLKVLGADTTVNAQKAYVCYQCHNTINSNVGSIPHNSQAEMFEGIGGYTYGETIASGTAPHKLMNYDCVDCHMSLTSTSQASATTHVMNMDVDFEKRVESCNSACHSNANIQFIDGHYELSGKRAELTALINELRIAINTHASRAPETEITAAYNVSGNQELSSALTYAAYNYNFVRMDRSSGAHNFRYAKKLLELSIADLKRFN